MLTHDGRRTTDDDGRQPIAIGHLSDSGDLKKSAYDQFCVVIFPCLQSLFKISNKHFNKLKQNLCDAWACGALALIHEQVQ